MLLTRLCPAPRLVLLVLLITVPFCFSLVQAKEALSGSGSSDYLVFSRAVLCWRRVHQEGDRRDRQDYLEDHTLSGSSLRFINGKAQFMRSPTMTMLARRK